MPTSTKNKKKAAKKPARKAPAKKASAQAKQPAGPASGPGTFCWNELLTKDVAGARAFYGSMFGWKFEEMPMGPAGVYTIFKRGKEHAGGCMAMPPGLAQSGARPMWTAYVQVDDVDERARHAATIGGKVCHGPDDIPGIGRFAVLTDPQGA